MIPNTGVVWPEGMESVNLEGRLVPGKEERDGSSRLKGDFVVDDVVLKSGAVSDMLNGFEVELLIGFEDREERVPKSEGVEAKSKLSPVEPKREVNGLLRTGAEPGVVGLAFSS